jgi:cytochrome P450 / NADPH-cytochrome P450 reductase
VPRYIDEQFSQKGAARFSPRGEADVSGDIEEQLQVWKQTMWTDAMEFFGITQFEVNQNTLNIQYLQKGNDSESIFPSNSMETVNRVLYRYRLNGKDQVILTTNIDTLSHLPLNRIIDLNELLRD